MSELSNIKQFNCYTNQVFPGGALFLVATDYEFKRLFMELTNAVLGDDDCRKFSVATVVGKNIDRHNTTEWILNPEVHISCEGQLIPSDNHKFLWLERPAVINSKISCHIKAPLDNGDGLLQMFDAIQAFMPENMIPVLAVVASFLMGSSYEDIISCSGCSSVPVLYGEPGSCKSEAVLCGLAVFGAHNSHLYNSQTTPSHLFDIMKQTTIPIAIDDISEKAQDMWEEIIIDAYNNTPRGTRAYNAERFRTLPILTSNWRYSSSKSRAYTRCICIPFVEHCDEPNATALYSTLQSARTGASASISKAIQICSEYSSPVAQDHINDVIFPAVAAIFGNSHVRFKTTMTVFMHFFLQVGNTWSCW